MELWSLARFLAELISIIVLNWVLRMERGQRNERHHCRRHHGVQQARNDKEVSIRKVQCGNIFW